MRDTTWRSRRASLSPANRRPQASRRFASGRPWTPWSRSPAAFAIVPPRFLLQKSGASSSRSSSSGSNWSRARTTWFTIVEHWAPDVVVHDVAEFAAPLVATRVGIPYVEHSYGPAIHNDVIRAAGEATAPFWISHGLAPHPLGGLYRYLYLDVCPPSLQVRDAVTGPVQAIRTVESQPPATQLEWLDALPRPPDRLHHARHRLQPRPRRVSGAPRRPPRRTARSSSSRSARRTTPRCSVRSRPTSTCTGTSPRSNCSRTAPLS